MTNKHIDVLIIGSGLAGLGLALRLADTASVAVVSKGPLHEGSSYYAQGGVAAVLGDNDSIQSHKQDTLDAGAGLCDPDTVDYVISHGPENIQWLIDQGVNTTLHKKAAIATDASSMLLMLPVKKSRPHWSKKRETTLTYASSNIRLLLT